MRLFIIYILLLMTINVWSQTELGIGLVSISYDENTILDLYINKADKEPEKKIIFFLDSTIKSWNIRDLEKQREWLKPEALSLDYSAFTFRCVEEKDNWLEVIVNNENGKTYWLKKTDLTIFYSWENYLKEMFGIERIPDQPQKIRTSPNDDSEEINYEGQDCFVVRSMKGDWIEITTPGYCDKIFTDFKTPIKTGWIRWREGNKLLINYFITC